MKASAHPADALAASRAKLQLLLLPAAGAARQGTDAQPAPPSAALMAALLQRWWRRHPWHRVGQLAAQAADVLARPVAQRHPVALVAGAFVVGAALVWARPWRWLGVLGMPLLRGLLRNTRP